MRNIVQPTVLTVQLVAAMCFIWTGAVKLADPLPIRRTITALSIPWPASAALLLATTELAAGAALIVMPAPWLAFLLVSALAVLFACAAAISVNRHLNVECACFGSRESTLGWRQFAMLPVWLAIALSVIAYPPMLLADRPALALAALLIVALPALRQLGVVYVEHRAQRIAIEGS